MSEPGKPHLPPETTGGTLLDRIAGAYAGQYPAASGNRDFSGQVFGSYRLLERVGRGGMGEVYRAERADGAYQNQVAVKLLRASIDSELQTRRFHRERQLLARLDHPGIARLLDGGSGPQDIPFLVMEWVEGEPITERIQRLELNLERRLALFAEVCRAVAYAHRNLIVHRDLKPSNVLVTREGKIKLLDFGIGKLLADEEDDDQPLTRTGAVPMTYTYAAPEQILGEPVTTATDVYALGVVLYEMVTGERPHRRDTRAPAALAAQVDTEVVTRPSEKVRRRANNLAARRMCQRLKGDLDTIVLTALKREPERRYASAEALLEDLRRHADGLPIRARPDTAGYRIGRFLHRHRIGVAAFALIMFALAGGLAAALWQANVARGEARRAENAHQLLLSLFRDQDPLSRALLEQQTPAQFLEEAAKRTRVQFERDPLQQARMFTELGELLMNTGNLEVAGTLLNDAVALRRERLGDDHKDTARSMAVLARLERLRGRYPESTTLADQAVEILMRRLGPDHPDTWRAQEVQILPWQQAGREEEAVELATALVQRYRDHYGETHAETAQRWFQLAELLEQLDRLEPARTAAETALATFTAALGEEHPRLLQILVTRGDLLRRLRDYQGAAEAYERGIALTRLHLGPDHPMLAGVYGRLGDTQRRRGALGEAEASLGEATRLALTAGRMDQLAQIWAYRAQIAAAREDWTAAVEAHRQSQQFAHQAYGGESGMGLYASIRLAHTLASAGEAEAAAAQLAGLSELLGDRDDTADLTGALLAATTARIARIEQRRGEAVEHGRKLQDIQQSIYGKHSPPALSAGMLLAEALLERGASHDPQEAEALLNSVRLHLESDADPGELSWYDLLWHEAALARLRGEQDTEQARLLELLALPEPVFARHLRLQRQARETIAATGPLLQE